MLRKYKQFLLGFLIASLLFSSITVFADITEIKAFLSDIKIALNGQLLELKDANGNKVMPIVYNGTTYLPVRALANAFEKEVNFNGTTNTVEIRDKVLISNVIDDKAEIEEYHKEGMLIYKVNNIEYVAPVEILDRWLDKNIKFNWNSKEKTMSMLDKKDNLLIERIVLPIIIKGRSCVEYSYYKDVMLPLIK